MKRERELELRLQSVRTLGQAVSAMKSLSAHHILTTRKALEAAQSYQRELDTMVDSTGASLPAGVGPRAVVVVGGDLGFCGNYNAKIAAAGAEFRQEHGPGPTFCVGRRAASYLRRLGVTVDRTYPTPATAAEVTEALPQLAHDLIEEYIDSDCQSLDIATNRFRGAGAFEPTLTRLLPIERPEISGAPPLRYATAAHTARVAVRELLYIALVELLLDALAAEHGARLVATQSAEQWLDERTTELSRRLSAARRESSTQEVIEISAGARAGRSGYGPVETTRETAV